MKILHRLWPDSLQGQVLLAIAAALLLAQGFSAALLYRAQHARMGSALVHTAAMRLIMTSRQDVGRDIVRGFELPDMSPDMHPEVRGRKHPLADGFRFERVAASPLRPGDSRIAEAERELAEILADQEIRTSEIIVARRPVAEDARARIRASRFAARRQGIAPDEVMIAAIRTPDAPDWLVSRVLVPQTERHMLQTLIVQTLLIFVVMVGAMALVLRRITRPLAALTGRSARFAQTRDLQGQIDPEGPQDMRALIEAHNAMERRIAALLDEKDVMLGAIGHDLKTPLAALRVRIESVDDEAERQRMAATIEDITRTLDDILSLARVGRPSDPAEPNELYALVASVVEEFEDMGGAVELAPAERTVVHLRQTWLRRALRNLIGNALRYGQRARVSLVREGNAALIRIADDGPGIPDDQIARMQEPFTRGEPSRNSDTGGAGLGLTLARAIAEQHGGSLTLANRCDSAGNVEGLDAVIRLPV